MNVQWMNARTGASYARTALCGVMKACPGLRYVSKTEWLALAFVLLSAILWWVSIEMPDQNTMSHLHSP
jgi:hypothetical protein